MTTNTTITATSTGWVTYTIPTITTTTYTINGCYEPVSTKREYKCAYCDTVYDHRTGKCENCGAPLGEAVEI